MYPFFSSILYCSLLSSFPLFLSDIFSSDSGFPNAIDLPGQADYSGTLVHSTEFKSAPAGTRAAAVIGTGTSAHDIAQRLHDQGVAEVTLVQRAPTTVISIDSHESINWKGWAGGEEMDEKTRTEMEIEGLHSKSFRRLESIHRNVVVPAIRANDEELLKGLKAKGFKTDEGEDGSGAVLKFLRRGAGYYFSVGASELICEGKIKVVGGGAHKLVKDGVELGGGGDEDGGGGGVVPADLVVAATGFGSMSSWVTEFCGPAVAEKVGLVYGYGSGTRDDPLPYEGELRNMYKPIPGVPGLWLFGGNFTQARFYSETTALLLSMRQ